MTNDIRLELGVIEQRVCDVASKLLGIPRKEVRPASRLLEDLKCDSLELVELMMDLEDEFDVTIPKDSDNSLGKSLFTRRPFRLSDFAEIVYLQLGTGKPEQRGLQPKYVPGVDASVLPFTQLSGRWPNDASGQTHSSFDPVESNNGVHQFRRRADGMRCVLIPSAEITIGSDGPESPADERPVHTVKLDSFVIDVEPVSTTAYCRFLNSVEPTEKHLLDWFVLDPTDDRIAQMPIALAENEWRPVAGVETAPMVLVSWHGANAYSLWANRA